MLTLDLQIVREPTKNPNRSFPRVVTPPIHRPEPLVGLDPNIGPERSWHMCNDVERFGISTG